MKNLESILDNNVSIKQIISWAFYDFATSAYFVVIFTFVFATYFTDEIALNTIEGTALWGYTISGSALLIALVSPFVGAIADYGGHHKLWLFSFTLLAVIAIVCLWFAYPNSSSIPLVLVCIFVSNFALEVATVFYNAFLPKLSSSQYIGRISGWAWGMGYLGGLICLIISLSIFVDGRLGFWLGTTESANIRVVPVFVAVWVGFFSLPFCFFVKPTHGRYLTPGIAIRKGWTELLSALRGLPGQKDLLLFLIARMFYIDGLNTLLALGGIYAAGTFGLKINEIMVFGIIINIMAGIGAALFALCDDWIGSKQTVLISLLCLVSTYCFLLTVSSVSLFWLTAPVIGVFVGPIQASSRTLLARLSKPEEITRMFGLFALSGKATSFLGPLLVGLVTAFSSSQKVGMVILIPFFLFGGLLMLFVKEPDRYKSCVN